MAWKCVELRLDIDRDAVERHPAPQPDADGGDLVLKAGALVRPRDPDADAVLAPFAANIEGRQRPDDPFLEARDIGPHVGPPPLQVEHHIGHPLAGAVIGELAATAGSRRSEIAGRAGRRPCRWCRRCRAADAPGARPVRGALPRRYRRRALPSPRPPRGRESAVSDISHSTRAPPGAARRCQIEALAVVNHWLTITW